MNSEYIPLFVFAAAFFAGSVGSGVAATLGIGVLLLFESWFVYKFLRHIYFHRRRNLIACIAISAAGVYAALFPFINNQELWVDEIQVIRFGRLPLDSIARFVMTEHTAVPPLDYWNMWVWDKVVSLFPISVWEYAYRVPYMMLHTLAALLLALVYCDMIEKRKHWTDAVMIWVGFLLYFFNPLPFVYSYEIRFYAMTLLGAAVVMALYYRNKLFSVPYYPLIVLFCLNSIYHFFILVPFLIAGMLKKETRRNAVLLYSAVGAAAITIVPFLYVPRPDSGIVATERIFSGLSWLQNFYLNPAWKVYAALSALLILCIVRTKRAVFFFGSALFYIFVVVILDMKYNYRYFGAKHFLYAIPAFTVLVYELMSVARSLVVRIGVVCVLAFLFLWPFYSYLYDTYTGKVLLAKSPLGLKQVFQYVSDHSVGTVIVDYGNATEEDIRYYELAISWYAPLYSKPKIIYRTGYVGCRVLTQKASALLYSVAGVPNCGEKSDWTVTPLFDSAMVTKP